ncbi:MAG TPA: hypothetical protein VGM76_07645 [Lacipirellulaceae bacterium]
MLVLRNFGCVFYLPCSERTNYAREVVEFCLSHVQGDPLERAYQRGRYHREAAPADAGVGRLLPES